jgi:hypothetical protein
MRALAETYTCPWCGCKAKEVWTGTPHDSEDDRIRCDWECGSFKHGQQPYQSDACRINALEALVERQRAVIRLVKAVRDVKPDYLEQMRADPEYPIWAAQTKTGTFIDWLLGRYANGTP